jgi:hypothetical protein
MILVSNISVGQPLAEAVLIKQAHTLLNQSILKRDIREVAKLCAPEFALISAHKQVSKDEFLEDMMSARFILEVNESVNVEVSVEGVTGYVTALLHQKGLSNGKAFDEKVQVREKWLRTVNGWKISELQTSITLSTLNETYNE